MYIHLKFITLLLIIIFPFIFLFLMEYDTHRFMIWLLPHHIYYLPLSWLGEPFFKPSTDVSFWVTKSGRILTIAVYSISWLLLVNILEKLKKLK